MNTKNKKIVGHTIEELYKLLFGIEELYKNYTRLSLSFVTVHSSLENCEGRHA